LIIFMVVVNSDSVGLDAKAPQESKQEAPQATPSQDIVLLVRGDGTVTLNREVIAENDLQPRLAQVFKMRGNHAIFVGADRELEFAPVVRAIDIARGVGFKQIALLPRGSF
jgi:biopolymer transport protein ExbD